MLFSTGAFGLMEAASGRGDSHERRSHVFESSTRTDRSPWLGQWTFARPGLAQPCPHLSFPVGRLAACGLPGGESKTYAPSPVWRDSTTKPVKFQAMPKRQAVKLWHDARRFERQTRQPGKQDGALGRNGLAVLHALLFDFLNYASGRLDPGCKAIAAKACISERSAARGLAKLKACGVVNWLRRCVEEFVDGRFLLKQLTNAYAVLPVSQWLGYLAPPPAPPLMRGTWGAPEPIPDPLTLACQAATAGGGIKAQVAALESDERDGLAAALARLGRLMAGRQS